MTWYGIATCIVIAIWAAVMILCSAMIAGGFNHIATTDATLDLTDAYRTEDVCDPCWPGCSGECGRGEPEHDTRAIGDRPYPIDLCPARHPSPNHAPECEVCGDDDFGPWILVRIAGHVTWLCEDCDIDRAVLDDAQYWGAVQSTFGRVYDASPDDALRARLYESVGLYLDAFAIKNGITR